MSRIGRIIPLLCCILVTFDSLVHLQPSRSSHVAGASLDDLNTLQEWIEEHNTVQKRKNLGNGLMCKLDLRNCAGNMVFGKKTELPPQISLREAQRDYWSQRKLKRDNFRFTPDFERISQRSLSTIYGSNSESSKRSSALSMTSRDRPNY